MPGGCGLRECYKAVAENNSVKLVNALLIAGELLRRLLALKHVTRLDDARRIDGDVSFVDVPDDAFFIDQERGAIAEALLLVEDSIRFHDRAFEIAEDGKRDFDLFRKFAVGGNTVDAHAENLGVG